MKYSHSEFYHLSCAHKEKLTSSYNSSPLYFVDSIKCSVQGCFLNWKLHDFANCACLHCRAATWARVSVWLAIGVVVYVFYGRTHSSLRDAVYVRATHVDKICQTSESCLA